MKTTLSVLLCGWALTPLVGALDFKDLSPSLQLSFLQTAAVMGLGEKPMAALPDGLKPPAARLSLLADYEHAAHGRIPVYLINRTDEAVMLAAQDGDIYLKLEVQEPDGIWRRAQPHQLSPCGNSYGFRPPLQDNRFIELNGYQPSAGRTANIRFRLYRQTLEIVSNVGVGIVSPADIESAQHDAFAVLGADFDYLASVALGTVPGPTIGAESARALAIWEVGERGFKRAQAKAVLSAIVASGDETFAKLARQQMSQIDRRREP